ncbi:MAG: tetrahydrofolate dehydrogenase/cyclohydrolase catalytic domain-containing protein, partial [Candidatus Neomarinimicrobiota bacterium]
MNSGTSAKILGLSQNQPPKPWNLELGTWNAGEARCADHLTATHLSAKICPPMETRIIDGRKVAEQIKAEVTAELQELSKKNLVPGLAAVLVGDDPGSQLYVRMKTRTCKELGMHSESIELPGETTTEELLQVVDRLNQAEEIDAILVQLPLPDQIDEDQILLAVRPDKDV